MQVCLNSLAIQIFTVTTKKLHFKLEKYICLLADILVGLSEIWVLTVLNFKRRKKDCMRNWILVFENFLTEHLYTDANIF